MSWDPSRAVCGALVTAAPMVATRDVSQRLWKKKPGCSVRKARTESQARPTKDISKIHSYCYSETTHPWWRKAAFAVVRVLTSAGDAPHLPLKQVMQKPGIQADCGVLVVG